MFPMLLELLHLKSIRLLLGFLLRNRMEIYQERKRKEIWFVMYLFTLSEDLELQLDGSFRGSRVPLLGTELNDFVDGGPECQLLVVRLLST